jgi:hypothetical protein
VCEGQLGSVVGMSRTGCCRHDALDATAIPQLCAWPHRTACTNCPWHRVVLICTAAALTFPSAANLPIRQLAHLKFAEGCYDRCLHWQYLQAHTMETHGSTRRSVASTARSWNCMHHAHMRTQERTQTSARVHTGTWLRSCLGLCRHGARLPDDPPDGHARACPREPEREQSKLRLAVARGGWRAERQM